MEGRINKRGRPPLLIDTEGLIQRKMKFHAKTILRTLGEGHSWTIPIVDKEGNQIGNYEIKNGGKDSEGNEVWIETTEAKDNSLSESIGLS